MVPVTTPVAPLPVIRGTHCAESDPDAVPPIARTIPRHRGASSGRRAGVPQSEVPASPQQVSPRQPAHSA